MSLSLSLLNEARPLLADGAMATNLFERGLRPGDPCELWNESHADTVQALHRDFLLAGADILLTNSFGGHPWRLRDCGLAGRTRDLNLHAARNARTVADTAGRPVMVAGAVGPTGACAGLADAAEGFAAQIGALAEGGVDLVWIETMSYPDEIRAAAGAAAELGLPYVLTASFDADGRTLGGLDPPAFAVLAAALPVPPLLIGANCGGGAEALLRTLGPLQSAAPGVPLAIKASAGLPEQRHGHFHYPMSPADMAAYARRAVECGAQVVGGCCGTAPAHLAAMKAALATIQPLAQPRKPS